MPSPLCKDSYFFELEEDYAPALYERPNIEFQKPTTSFQSLGIYISIDLFDFLSTELKNVYTMN